MKKLINLPERAKNLLAGKYGERKPISNKGLLMGYTHAKPTTTPTATPTATATDPCCWGKKFLDLTAEELAARKNFFAAKRRLAVEEKARIAAEKAEAKRIAAEKAEWLADCQHLAEEEEKRLAAEEKAKIAAAYAEEIAAYEEKIAAEEKKAELRELCKKYAEVGKEILAKKAKESAEHKARREAAKAAAAERKARRAEIKKAFAEKRKAIEEIWETLSLKKIVRKEAIFLVQNGYTKEEAVAYAKAYEQQRFCFCC